MKAITQPTLILQCQDDVLVPPSVWKWLTDNMQSAELVVLDAMGHCPHVSYPEATTEALNAFLRPRFAA